MAPTLSIILPEQIVNDKKKKVGCVCGGGGLMGLDMINVHFMCA